MAITAARRKYNREAQRRYRAKHPKKVAARSKAWRDRNPEYQKEYQKDPVRHQIRLAKNRARYKELRKSLKYPAYVAKRRVQSKSRYWANPELYREVQKLRNRTKRARIKADPVKYEKFKRQSRAQSKRAYYKMMDDPKRKEIYNARRRARRHKEVGD